MVDRVDIVRAALEEEFRLDPVWRYFRDLAGMNHRRAFSSTARRQCIFAGQRTGKTTLIRCEAAAYFRGIHPFRPRTRPVPILVIAPSLSQLATIYRKGFLDESMLYVRDELAAGDPSLLEAVKRPLIPECEIRKNNRGRPDIKWANTRFGKAPGMIPHVDGTEMYFHISGDPNSWKRIEGMDFAAIFRDEAIGDDNIGNTLVTRQMEYWDKADLPEAGFYKWGATELAITQEWIDFRKRCEDGEKFHEFIELKPEDNPKVTLKNRQDAAAGLSKEEADKRVWGTDTAVGGALIYKGKFDRARHVMAEHYEPSDEANLWAVWDPGLRHPFGLLCGAIEPENPFQLRVCRFYSETRKTLDYQVNLLAAWLDGRTLEGFIYDSSGATKSDYSRGEQAFVQFEDLLRRIGVKVVRGFLPSKNRYEVTIPMVWRYLDPDPNDKTATPLIMVNPPSPKAPGCETLIEQMYTYRFKDSLSTALKGENIHKINDEACDCLRYWCSREPRWVQRPPNPPKHRPFVKATAIQAPRTSRDPFAIRPDMTPEQVRHVQMLAESAKMVRAMRQNGRRRLPECYVGPL